MKRQSRGRSEMDENLQDNTFGMWAAVSALAASIAYGIPQLLQVAGVLGDPWDRILIFAPSLTLAPAFVLTMVAVHITAPASKQIWSLSALALAIMYAVLVSIAYVTQLGVVIPADLRGDGARTEVLACCGAGQFLTAVDLLGYTMMSLSTLFAVPVFMANGQHRVVGLWLLANGVLAPFLIMQLAFPQLIYIGALWLITFPGSMLFLTLYFRSAEGEEDR